MARIIDISAVFTGGNILIPAIVPQQIETNGDTGPVLVGEQTEANLKFIDAGLGSPKAVAGAEVNTVVFASAAHLVTTTTHILP